MAECVACAFSFIAMHMACLTIAVLSLSQHVTEYSACTIKSPDIMPSRSVNPSALDVAQHAFLHSIHHTLTHARITFPLHSAPIYINLPPSCLISFPRLSHAPVSLFLKYNLLRTENPLFTARDLDEPPSTSHPS